MMVMGMCSGVIMDGVMGCAGFLVTVGWILSVIVFWFVFILMQFCYYLLFILHSIYHLNVEFRYHSIFFLFYE